MSLFSVESVVHQTVLLGDSVCEMTRSETSVMTIQKPAMTKQTGSNKASSFLQHHHHGEQTVRMIVMHVALELVGYMCSCVSDSRNPCFIL